MDLHTYLSRDGAESMAALAKEVDVHVDQVRQWRHHTDGRRPSAEMCLRFERATSGALKCEDLRPDLTWRRVRDKAWPWNGGKPLQDHAPAEAAAR